MYKHELLLIVGPEVADSKIRKSDFAAIFEPESQIPWTWLLVVKT